MATFAESDGFELLEPSSTSVLVTKPATAELDRALSLLRSNKPKAAVDAIKDALGVIEDVYGITFYVG